MIKNAKGEGLSSCHKCIKLGKWHRCWTSFLYEVEGHEGYYCYEHAKELENNLHQNKNKED